MCFVLIMVIYTVLEVSHVFMNFSGFRHAGLRLYSRRVSWLGESRRPRRAGIRLRYAAARAAALSSSFRRPSSKRYYFFVFLLFFIIFFCVGDRTKDLIEFRVRAEASVASSSVRFQALPSVADVSVPIAPTLLPAGVAASWDALDRLRCSPSASTVLAIKFFFFIFSIIIIIFFCTVERTRYSKPVNNVIIVNHIESVVPN